VDLEKAFDRVLREVIRCAMCKLGADEWLVSAVMYIYMGAQTVVRTVRGNSDNVEVKVGMHQGSALSLLLFMAALRSRCGHCIFVLFLSFFLSFFPRLISAVADWMSTILPHMVWPWCEFRMQV